MQPDFSERRRNARIAAMILCELAIGDSRIGYARVRDLCATGIKIATPHRFLLGERVRVRLPASLTWVNARVAWCGHDTADLAFLRAIEPPQVSGARPFVEKSDADPPLCFVETKGEAGAR